MKPPLRNPGLDRIALLKQANACLRANSLAQGESICTELLRRNKKDSDALELLAQMAFADSRHEEAYRYMHQCIANHPKQVRFRHNLGMFYAARGRFAEAVTQFTRALQIAPGNQDLIAGLADTLHKSGDRERATELVKPLALAGRAEPVIISAYARLASSAGEHEQAIAVLEALRAQNKLPPDCYFVLGRAYEHHGRYDEAFVAYDAGNRAINHPFNLDDYRRLMDELIATFTKDLLARLPRGDGSNHVPVLVVGRPRSGTTLIAKIIASHPEAADAGELPTLLTITKRMNLEIGSTLTYPKCVRDADRDDIARMAEQYMRDLRGFSNTAQRIVDKSLGLYQTLGLAQLLVPGARVIQCLRDPIDTCFACYSENMGMHHAYSYDLRTLGITERLHQRLMQHWRDTLDFEILDVRYEDVVDDLEAQTRRMLEFVGLAWDDRCLHFYKSEGGGAAKVAAMPTLSHDQVRKPIYRSSINRAQPFMKHLGPLLEALKEGG